ncbi:hypothetical protein HG536_0F03450 [Torulaspora globosa]|uniref:Uncharacterized protein n=1 Tax=Torulaspora globosa TaxID=48254 RepID=A0A7G3ZKI4_9SACH|nr:uncharacterized protein HG536_0F03450 [Torulaspora globosa]QLL34020.1 hypothetical protein HG536_0F03450 [Torulaspora globosa]
MMLEARSAGAGDVAGVAVMQLQDIKEEEDVELTRLDSDGSSEPRQSGSGTLVAEEKQQYVEKEVAVVESGGGSRDDLSLLPPLPNTIERVVEREDAEEQTNSSVAAEPQATVVPDAASQFDLSKALEIPVSFSAANNETSTINNTGSHSDSSLSLTPLITSPKLSLKKKFSTVTPEGSPSDGCETRAHGSVRNRSNSNVAAFQHILPTLNMAIEAGAYQQPQAADKKLIRKFSFGDSSSLCTSSNSLSETEMLYRAPPPMLGGQRSRSGSNPLNNAPLEGMNTPNSSILEADSSPRKVPLLRRASSAILRKTSLRSSAGKEVSRSSSASATPILHNGPVFDCGMPVKTPCRNATSSRSLLEGGSSIMNNLESDDELLYVTPLNGTPEGPFRNPSIRSRVRRGFSRIISSSGSVRRVASSASNLRDVPQGHEPEQIDSSRIAPLSTSANNTTHAKFELGRNSFGSSKNSSPIEARRSVSNPLVTPISTSTAMTPTTSKTQQQGEITDQWSHGVARPGSMDYFDQSNGARGYENPESGSLAAAGAITETTEEKRINQKDKDQDVGEAIENDITVDLDKLTQSIPVITVTDKLNSNDYTAVQLQSNIILDEVYKGKNYKNDKRYIGGTRDKHDESKKPEMMTLSEYTGILMRQQQIEDERLAVVEKNFRDSGWCSNDDLMNLKQKRVMISKKWAERISFYQNKLDS